jgi:hypothetical protein
MPNTTEEIFSTHSVKLVKPIPKNGEMCNFMCLPHEPIQNEWIKVTKPKKKERFTSKPIKHDREFSPRIQMKKGTTRDFSHQMVYGPKPCKPRPNNRMEYKSTKVSAHHRHMNRMNSHLLRPPRQVDVSRAYLHCLTDKKPKEKGVQSAQVRNEKIGDWFNREFGDWFHTEEAKMHREQLKRMKHKDNFMW